MDTWLLFCLTEGRTFATDVSNASRTQLMDLLHTRWDPQLLALFAGGTATVLLLVTTFSIDKRSHWDFLFRPLVPFIAITLFFLPSLALDNSMIAALVLLTGYMCFEALMWVFFGELSQEFRLSPIFVFGIGRGCLALGSIAGSLSMADPAFLSSLSPFGEAGGAVLIMLAMVVAYALLPRVRDIKRIVVKGGRDFDAIESFNHQIERVVWASRRTSADASDDGAETEALPLPTPGTLFGMGSVPAETPSDLPTYGSAGTPGWRAASIGSATPSKLAADTQLAKEPAKEASKEPDAASSEAERSRKSGRFCSQCEVIADRYLLSRRETEVMFLLAKGHNAAYIQDKLYISPHTVKSHTYKIYRKLGVSSREELLTLVENAPIGDDGDGAETI